MAQWIRWAAAMALCVSAAASAQTSPGLKDSDGDGRPDILDNCVFVPNPDQRDSNGNGIGDACDADVNGDGIVNAIDLALLRQQFGRPGGSADLNGDGIVDERDLALLRSRFGQRPGPAGEVLQRMRRIDPRVPPEGPSGLLDATPADPSAPAVLLAQVLEDIDRAVALPPPRSGTNLLRARLVVVATLANLRDGSADGSLGYLRQVMAGLRRAHADIGEALTLESQEPQPILISLLVPAVMKVREAAERVSGALLLALANGGVSTQAQLPAQAAHQQGLARLAAGEPGPALDAFERAVAAATPLLSFNLNRFENLLRSVFDTQSVGWAYAIARNGVLQRSGSLGLARTAANAPATLQTETKRMHVASISKTLTAIVTLRLLADLGLTADEPIGPWLPSHWPRGVGVDALRFRDLMTHRSGFEQNAVAGSSYAELRDVIARNVGVTSYAYNNANFGLLRVLVARLAGVDAAAYGEFDGGQLTAAVFLFRAQQLYDQIGVPFHCSGEAQAPTRSYLYPDPGTSGFLDPDRSLQCGGYGVNISALNLARVLSFWRYTEQLLPAAMRTAMRQQYLGLMDPGQFGMAQGSFGVYQGHGGDWDHDLGGLDTCMYAFPNQIEASVVVNSSRKTSGGYVPVSHQCSVLKWAYEGAWVAN